MTKVLSIPVEEEVYDILQPMAELQILGRFLADFAQRQKTTPIQQRNWLGKVYKVNSFQPLTRDEVHAR
jgi:hypothetical protein